jgi:hypothetical protein
MTSSTSATVPELLPEQCKSFFNVERVRIGRGTLEGIVCAKSKLLLLRAKHTVLQKSSQHCPVLSERVYLL